jgi:hypothetical protein
VIRDYNPLFHEELANQLPNQRSKKISSCRFHAFYIGWDGGCKYLVKTNCLPGLPNGTSIAPSKSKFDAGSSVSPLNNSTYLSFLGRRRMEVYQSIRTYQFRIRKSRKKSSELAEKLVDQRLQQPQRRIS